MLRGTEGLGVEIIKIHYIASIKYSNSWKYFKKVNEVRPCPIATGARDAR